ncbi:MAG: YXWGXW repeat-containing protein [Alphaproteobacteria bacterium]|nr:YXWGXW repeat-containing protein [Alphaproteobacteria bacterium]MCW5738743.1 YXWGXW repeat-containing protein [Alphaproteobacteria bacterium]
MLRRGFFALAAGAAALGVAGLTATTASAQNWNLAVPPPSPRYEAPPPPRGGYTWAPGYWGWDGRRHVWHRGRWMQARRGYHWVPAQWVDIDPGPRRRWRFVPGHWERAQAWRRY